MISRTLADYNGTGNDPQKPKTLADYNKTGISQLTKQQQIEQAILDARAKIPTQEAATTMPFLRDTTISAPKETPGLKGVSLNKPSSGLPLITVDDPHIVTTPESPWWAKVGGAAANAVLGTITNTSQKLGDLFNVIGQTNLETGKPTKPIERAAAMIDLGAATVGLAFTPVSAELSAAQELPIVGPAFGAVNKGFEFLDTQSRTGAKLALNSLPIPQETKDILMEPLQNLAGIAGTLLGVKALHGIAETGGGKIVEKLPVSEKAKANIRAVTKIGASTALAPFQTAYKGIAEGIISRTNQTRAATGDITSEQAQTIVNQVVKDHPIPQDQGVMKVLTPTGQIDVHTNQKTVLQNLIKGRENIEYRREDTLGKDINGNPIASRFEWDYKNKKGIIYTTDSTTAANLAHEIGHYVDRQLGSAINARLSDVLPNYTQNRDQVNQSLADFAVKKLGGEATPEEINAEIVKIADNLNQEIQTLAVGEARRTSNELFAHAFGGVIDSPELRSKAPELAQLVDFTIGSENMRKGGEKTIQGTPGSVQEKASTMMELKKTQKQILSETKKSPEFQNKVISEQNKAEVVSAKASRLENYDWKSVIKSIKNSKEFQKEKSISDATTNGVIMERGDRTILVPREDVNQYIERGYTKKATMDEIANAEGFKNAQDYVDYVTELDQESRSINRSPIQKQAHEYLMKNDPNYANLNATIDKLRSELLKENGVSPSDQTSTTDARPTNQKSFTPTPYASIDEFIKGSYEKAPQAKAEADSIARDIAEKNGGILIEAPLKKPEKVIANIEKKYEGDWNRVSDIARNTIVANDQTSLAKVAEDLKNNPNLYSFKIVSSAEDPYGYSGINARVITSSGMLAEIQANTPDMIYAKEKASDARAMLGEKLFSELDAKYGGRGGHGHEFYDRGFVETNAQKKADIAAESKQYYKEFQQGEVKPSETIQTQPGMVAGTGLDTGKNVKDRLSYRPDKINAPEDVEQLIGAVSKASGEFSEQRMSKNDAAIKSLAFEVGMTPEELMKVQPGSIANAETVFKSRQIMTDMAADLRDTVRSLTKETASPADLALVKEKLLRLQGVMKTVAGFRTEASNVFRQFRLETTPGENDLMSELLADLKKVDVETNGDLSQFITKTRELSEPSVMDKAWHVWYASILSGPNTQFKNFIGNTSNLISELGRVSITAPHELPSALIGLQEGLKIGKSEFSRVLKEGEYSKFEKRGLVPIVFKGKTSFLNYADYVGRFMSATDAFFKEGFRGMETRSLALEQAKKEGYTGQELQDRINELVSAPTEEIGKRAMEFAERGTYTNKPDGVLGWVSSSVENGLSQRKTDVGVVKVAKNVGRLIVPFTRIVSNVINAGLDWTPAGALKAKRIIDMGGTERQRNQQIARAVIGTLGMAALASVAADGNLSGHGPRDKKRREQLLATGWQPNSVKIGDKWYPFTGWGPAAIPMAIVGNLFDGFKYENIDKKQWEKQASYTVMNTVNTILDVSFLSNLSSLLTAISDPNRSPDYIQKFIAQQISSVDPAAIKQIAKWADPGQYETNTLLDNLSYDLRITGGLKPKLNVWGDQMISTRFTGVEATTVTKDPVLKFMGDNQLFISIPSKTTQLKISPKEKRPMSPDEYYTYIKESGPEIKKQIGDRMNYIKNLGNQEDQQKYIDKIVDEVRTNIKSKIERSAR